MTATVAGLTRCGREAGPQEREHRAELVGWHEARERAHRLAEPLPVEQIALGAAAGRTLAAPLVAATDVPGFDNAAMDGYAVRGRGPWRLTGRVLAGQPASGPLHDGEALEIATGAPVPAGADRVVRYEAARLSGDRVDAPDDGRTHIRRAGEYVRRGQQVLATGTALHAAALGFAASVGIDTVVVRRRARVRILVTGDEITSAGVPTYGKVRDAIGPAMSALLPAWGADVETVRTVRDGRTPLARAVGVASSTVDLVVVCGSSSVGPADHLHGLLRDLGAEVAIDGVACRPGHPQLLARLGATWIVGLPGNPYAALVAACTIVQPMLAGLAGRALPPLVQARLQGAATNDERRTLLVPVRWEANQACVIDGARPGCLSAAAHADALAAVTPDFRPGSAVDLVPLPGG